MISMGSLGALGIGGYLARGKGGSCCAMKFALDST